MPLKSKYILIAFFFFPCFVFSQARLVMNNTIYLVMNNQVNIVLENPNSNAITETGIGSHIISEHENNKLHWHIGNQTGTYLVPFTTKTILQGGNETRIPFEVYIANAGDNGGKIVFSTYETTTDMNAPWASDVTHMDDNNGNDNSLMVSDRFWMIDAESYVTKPDVELYFYYESAANELAGTNTITESNLIAQRFNTSQNKWGDYTGGIVNTTIDKMEQVVVPAADFYRTWVLVDNSSWLPVELISFTSECDNHEIKLKWSTASESNSDFFSIEYSYDLQNWKEAGRVDAAGNSVSQINYEFNFQNIIDNEVYFRLKQVDLNGEIHLSNFIHESCLLEDQLISLYPNPNNGKFWLVADNSWVGSNLNIFNSIGQIVYSTQILSQNESVNLEKYPVGIYHLEIFGNNPSIKRFKISKF